MISTGYGHGIGISHRGRQERARREPGVGQEIGETEILPPEELSAADGRSLASTQRVAFASVQHRSHNKQGTSSGRARILSCFYPSGLEVCRLCWSVGFSGLVNTRQTGRLLSTQLHCGGSFGRRRRTIRPDGPGALDPLCLSVHARLCITTVAVLRHRSSRARYWLVADLGHHEGQQKGY